MQSQYKANLYLSKSILFLYLNILISSKIYFLNIFKFSFKLLKFKLTEKILIPLTIEKNFIQPFDSSTFILQFKGISISLL